MSALPPPDRSPLRLPPRPGPDTPEGPPRPDGLQAPSPAAQPLLSNPLGTEREGPASPQSELKYEWLYAINDAPAPPRLFGLLGSADGQTLLYGDGGTGKSIFALALALSVAAGRDLVEGLMPTIHGPVMWVDYEYRRRATRLRATGVAPSPAPVIYVPGLGPIDAEVDRLVRIRDEEGVVMMVVDSVAYAVGGTSARDDESAIRYATAVRSVGIPTLSIAHIPKAQDSNRPYGSAFWFNSAAEAWLLEKVKGASHLARLTNTKANDNELSLQLQYEIEWGERVTFRRRRPGPLPDDEIVDAVAAVAAMEPAATRQVHDHLIQAGWKLSQDAVAERLSRLSTAGKIGREGNTRATRWLVLTNR